MSLEVQMDGLDRLRNFIGDVKKNLVNRKVLENMAAEAKERVLERTAAGRDILGAPFRPYSEEYRKARVKRGLSGRRVDLKSTGEMLKDISAKSFPARGLSTVSFNDGKNALKASFHHEEKGGREFFGLDHGGRAALERILEEHIDEVIRDAH